MEYNLSEHAGTTTGDATVDSWVSTLDSGTEAPLDFSISRPLVAADAIILDDRLKDEERFPLGYSSDMSAGMDLYACIDEPVTLEPGECKLIGAGVAIYLNNNSIVGLITPRSGLGHKHGIVLGNLTGVIDADYQGEIKVSLWNRGDTYTVQPMDRIAQYLVVPQFGLSLNFVDSFEESGRGAGGFGSSGR